MANYNTEEILRESQENVKKLNEKLKDIESLHNEIKESVSLSLKNPKLFKELAEKVNDAANIYLKENNNIFEQKIEEISKKTSELSLEINRLIEVDFNTLFQEIETKFLENSKVEIRKELDKFDEKTKSLQNKIDDLSNEISRLSKIDLEEHFNRHQSKLSEVFISVNGINSVITSISQNINKIIQNFGDFEQSLLKTQKEITKNFDILTENQEESSRKLIEKLTETDIKINAITTQNEMLKKELDFNKKLSFGIVVLVIISIIISLI